MLLYDNQSFWRVVFQVKGSVFMRRQALVFGLMVAGATEVLAILINIDSEYAPWMPHHYGILGISSIMTFATVFRMNLAWARYWEAMSQQHLMYSKWADAFAQFCAFAHAALTEFNTGGGGGGSSGASGCEDDYLRKSQRIYYTMHNLKKHFSLLSAVAADRLTHGDTHIMEKKARKDRWKDQVMLRGELRNDPDWEKHLQLPEFADLSDMRHKTRLTLEDLEQRDKKGRKQLFFVAECPNDEEVRYLKSSTDRVSTVMYWILYDLAFVSGDLTVAAPIQSRMFQELSNGMLGFSNSLKIADVPFPFPYAQVLNLLLLAFSCFIPVYVSVFTTSVIASPLLAFIFFEGLWCVNSVAKELENPFGSDTNGISLEDFHMRFMNTMRDLEPAQQFKTTTVCNALEAMASSRDSVHLGHQQEQSSEDDGEDATQHTHSRPLYATRMSSLASSPTPMHLPPRVPGGGLGPNRQRTISPQSSGGRSVGVEKYASRGSSTAYSSDRRLRHKVRSSFGKEEATNGNNGHGLNGFTERLWEDLALPASEDVSPKQGTPRDLRVHSLRGDVGSLPLRTSANHGQTTLGHTDIVSSSIDSSTAVAVAAAARDRAARIARSTGLEEQRQQWQQPQSQIGQEQQLQQPHSSQTPSQLHPWREKAMRPSDRSQEQGSDEEEQYGVQVRTQWTSRCFSF